MLCLLLAFFLQPVNKVHGQSITSGNTFEQILGDNEEDHNSIDQIMVFNMCGVEEWCTHVVKWKDSGNFELINNGEHEWGINDDEIAGMWVKGSKSELKNLAFKRDTKVLSESNPSSLAVDGNKDNQYQSCFYSVSTDISPWWRVAFGAPVLVYSVTITNTGGGFYPYLAALFKEVDIRVGYQDTNGVNPYCRRNISIATPTTVDFRCDNEMPGTFLFIEKQTVQLYLCEVEVFGIFFF
eukprot:gene7193-12863_t